MAVYSQVILCLYGFGLVVSLAAGKAQTGLQQLMAGAIWLPVAGRVIGWW